MKRTLLILSLITFTATLSRAQYANKARIMIFGEAGLNFSTFYQSANQEKHLGLGNATKPMLGLYVKVKYPTYVGFDAGVSLSQQGCSTLDRLSSVALFGDSALSKAVLNYGYVYGDGLYYFELIGDNSVHAGAGLYMGYLINGDRQIDSEKQKLNMDEWKRFDLGLQLKTAFNYKEFLTVGVQYRIAFVPTKNSIDKTGNPNNLRNSVLTLSAGIRLFQILVDSHK
jgi:hypothetical protein